MKKFLLFFALVAVSAQVKIDAQEYFNPAWDGDHRMQLLVGRAAPTGTLSFATPDTISFTNYSRTSGFSIGIMNGGEAEMSNDFVYGGSTRVLILTDEYNASFLQTIRNNTIDYNLTMTTLQLAGDLYLGYYITESLSIRALGGIYANAALKRKGAVTTTAANGVASTLNVNYNWFLDNIGKDFTLGLFFGMGVNYLLTDVVFLNAEVTYSGIHLFTGNTYTYGLDNNITVTTAENHVNAMVGIGIRWE